MELIVSGPARDLKGSLRPPGDKSITHRALLFASLAHGPSRLRGFLRSGVTQAMLDCLTALGVEAEALGSDDLLVLGRDWRSPAAPLDCRNSGATMRMLLGALAGRPLEATLQGSERLHRRPMGRVVEPLRLMGARICGQGDGDQPPLQVRGTQLHGITYRLPVASAQVKTALLLAGLHAEGSTTLWEPAQSRDHTERMLQSLGVSLAQQNGRITLNPGHEHEPLPPFTLTIPGDFSSAAFTLAAGAVVPGARLEMLGVGVNPTRTGLLEAMEAMGAVVQVEGEHLEGGEPVANLKVRSGEMRAVEIGGAQVVRMIDEFPVFAVIATQAQGESVVRDAQELRLKESDRIAALVSELRKMGAAIEEHPDGFVVSGPTELQGAAVDSHGDHRLAMALTVAGLIARGETLIGGAECITESYPGFAETLVSLGASIR